MVDRYSTDPEIYTDQWRAELFRERMGPPIKRVCLSCHAMRLRGDLAGRLNAKARKRRRAEGETT